MDNERQSDIYEGVGGREGLGGNGEIRHQLET